VKDYLLGIDIGSGSIKLTLLDKDGKIAAVQGCEYPTEFPQPGWSEQDPEKWCDALCQALKGLFKQNINPAEIRGIAPDAATHTAVLLDETIRPLRNAILWTDLRSGEEVDWLKQHYADLIKRETLNTPTTIWTLPQFLWLQKHKPGVWEKVRHILFAKDYLRYCLTGELATDEIDAAGSMFYDVVNRCWSPALCEAGKIAAEWLPAVLSPAELAGKVTREAAGRFGLVEGIPVYAGTTDTVMEQLAAGNVAIGHSSVKLATAGRICVISDKASPSPFLFNYRHVVEGFWYPGTATASCAASFRWFRDALGNVPFKELDEMAEGIPPGSNGVMFHPYLQGELTPYNDSKLRASFTGISSSHNKAHFTRAVLEGVAFSLLDCIGTLQEEHLTMRRTRIIGGGAKSVLWRQIVADVLGMTLEKTKVDDSSFGSAMLAGVGLGWFKSFKEAAEQCIEVDSIINPNMENHGFYAKQFKKYKKIHDLLAPFYMEQT
jgi:xylulokinase